MSLLNPKILILNAVKEKIKDTPIQKIVMVFGVLNFDDKGKEIKNEEYSIMLLAKDDKKVEFAIEETEITLIKKLFVKKLLKQINKKLKNIVVSIEPYKDEINIYFELLNDGSIEKFDI